MTDAVTATAPTPETAPIVGKVGDASYRITDSAVTKPSEQLTNAADSRIVVTDARGRGILLRKPKVLEQYRFVEALGDTAKNEVYMGMVMPLLFIGAIDGVPTATPTHKGQVEALIQRLDDDGITAVMEGVAANFGAPDEDDTKNG